VLLEDEKVDVAVVCWMMENKMEEIVIAFIRVQVP
jgi:hypothetical protein